jgi:NAD(P)-dependent dehydrogenase (short-subunit alcohol dehydrogenase family)
MSGNSRAGFEAGKFAGRTAFITGAASGIGFGLAQALARAGANIAIADVRADALEQARRSLEADGAKVMAAVLDVGDRERFFAVADEVEERFGNVHLLVNNAGIAHTGTPLDQVDAQTIDWLFAVNVFGVTNGMAALVPRMRRHREGGHIVNTSSMAGLFMVPGWHIGLYSSTKMAVVALSLGMRLALAEVGIGVSVLCPGRVRSDLKSNSATLGPHPDPLVSNVPPEVELTVMTAARAAQIVLAGIQANRSIILTHPDHDVDVAAYQRTIMDEFAYWKAAVPGIAPDLWLPPP